MKASRMSDSLVLGMRRQYSKEPFIITHKAKELGVGKTAFYDALVGVTYKHLPDPIEPRRYTKLTHEEINELRKRFKKDRFKICAEAAILNISVSTLKEYLYTAKHPCITEPPVIVVQTKKNLYKIKDEYKIKPFSIQAKARELGINVATLSRVIHGD